MAYIYTYDIKATKVHEGGNSEWDLLATLFIEDTETKERSPSTKFDPIPPDDDFDPSYSREKVISLFKFELKNTPPLLFDMDERHPKEGATAPKPGEEADIQAPKEVEYTDAQIQYEVQGTPTLYVDEKAKKKGQFTQAYFWDFIVTNNIELPNYKFRFPAAGNPSTFASSFTKAARYAKVNDIQINAFTSDYDPDIIGNEPQELKDLIWEWIVDKIIKDFTDAPPRIQEESYNNEFYPKMGTQKNLYNQDPIPYTFKSTVVDKTSQEVLSGVKIKDLDGVKTKSEPDGKFEITSTFSPGKVQKLIFNLKKYEENFIIITTLNGSIRSDINIVELNPNVGNSDSSVLKAQGTSKEERKRMSKEERADFAKKTAEEAIQEIKKRAIPYVIKKLLCEPYGVCDPIGLIEKAKELKAKGKSLNEKRKEKKAQKQAEKELENEITDNQDGGSLPATNE